jgi:hypothetical protein
LPVQAKEGEPEEAVKKKRQAAHAAHARLRSPHSDALSALAAFCAYMNATDREGFCRWDAIV